MKINLTPDQIADVRVDHNVEAPATQWKMLVTFSVPLEFGMEMLAAKSREPQIENKPNKPEEKQDGEVEKTHIPEITALPIKARGVLNESAERTKQQILDAITEYGPVTASNLMLEFGLSDTYIHRITGELLDENRIVTWYQRGKGKRCVVYTESSVELDSTFYVRRDYTFARRKNAADEILAYMRQVNRPVTRDEITRHLSFSSLTLKKTEKALLEQGKIQLGQIQTGFARRWILPEHRGTTDQAIQSVLDWCRSFIPAFLDAKTTTPELGCAIKEEKGHACVFIRPGKFKDLILENDPEPILQEMKKRGLLVLTRSGEYRLFRHLPKNKYPQSTCYGILISSIENQRPVTEKDTLPDKLKTISPDHREVFNLLRDGSSTRVNIQRKLGFGEGKTQSILNDLIVLGFVSRHGNTASTYYVGHTEKVEESCQR